MAEDCHCTTETSTMTVRKECVTPSGFYNKLTTSFQPLAEDISKHLELANMLHGFIMKGFKTRASKAWILENVYCTITSQKVITTSSPTCSAPITRPLLTGRLKTKQYPSMNESIIKISKKPQVMKSSATSTLSHGEVCQQGGKKAIGGIVD